MAVAIEYGSSGSPSSDFELWEREFAEHDQLRDELASEFIEALPVNFITRYKLRYVDGQLVDKDGWALTESWLSHHRDVEQFALQHPEHMFQVARTEADYNLSHAIDTRLMAEMPVGTTWLTFSPFPEQVYGLYPKAVLDRNYRPESQRGILWIHRKLSHDELELVTMAVDGKSFAEHRQKFCEISGIDQSLITDSEALPHHTAELALDGDQFQDWLNQLMAWAEIDEDRDSRAELERYGADVIDDVYAVHHHLDQAQTARQLPSVVIDAIQDMLDQPKAEQSLSSNQLDYHLLQRALVPDRQLDAADKYSLKRAYQIASYATILRRMNMGDNQSYRDNLSLSDERTTSAQIFIAAAEQYGGCPGSMAEQFAATMVAGRMLKNWGKDTGPGICKDCNQPAEQRGGCEVCVKCHIKHETLETAA